MMFSMKTGQVIRVNCHSSYEYNTKAHEHFVVITDLQVLSHHLKPQAEFRMWKKNLAHCYFESL